MHVHVAKGKRDSVKLKTSEQFVPIAESASTKAFFLKVWLNTRACALWLSFSHKDWSILGTEIMDTLTAIDIAEKEAFEILRGEVKHHCFCS